jgi:LuxR family maltose regulon positive regulatory protein
MAIKRDDSRVVEDLPPSLDFAPLPRQRLMDSILPMLQDGACVLALNGPSGSAKTTTLVQIADLFAAENWRVLWLNLGANGSAESLIKKITGSLHIKLSGMALAGVADMPLKTVDETILRRLIDGIAGQPRNILLVLDSCDLGLDQRLVAAVNFLMRHRPDNFTVAMAVSGGNPFSLSKIRLQGKVAELGFAELCFTEDEVAELVVAKLGELHQHVTERVLALSGGWPLLVQHIVTVMGQLQSGVETQSLELQVAEAIDSFVHEEIINNLPPPIVNALEKNCLPAIMVAQQVNENLSDGLTFEQIRRHPTLADLLNEVDSRKGHYRLNAALRGYLLGRYRSRYGETETRRAYRAMSEWCVQHDEPINAIEYALLAGDYEEALQLLEEFGVGLVVFQDFERVYELLQMLPPDKVATSHDIMIQLGIICNMRNQPAQTEQIVRNLYSSLRLSASADEAMIWKVKELEVWAIYMRQDYARLAALCDEYFEVEFDYGNDPYWRVPWYTLQGCVYLHRLQFSRALERFQEEIDLPASRQSSQSMVLRYAYSAVTLLEMGKFSEAEKPLLVMRESTVQYYGVDSSLSQAANFLLGIHCHYAGNADASRRLLAVTTELSLINAPPVLRYHSTRAMVSFYTARGEHTRALEYAVGELQRAVEQNLIEAEAALTHQVIKLQLALGEIEQAESMHTGWLERINAIPDCIALQECEKYVEEWALLNAGVMAISQESWEEANDVLLRVYHAFRESGRAFRQLVVGLLLCRCEYQLGNREAAQQYLIEALEIGGATTLPQLFIDAGEEVLSLLPPLRAQWQAAPAVKQHRVLQEKISIILGGASADLSNTVLRPATEGAPEETETDNLLDQFTRREIHTLKQLIKGHSNREIAENLFISLPTVKSHLRSAYQKMGVEQRTQAVCMLMEMGITPD